MIVSFKRNSPHYINTIENAQKKAFLPFEVQKRRRRSAKYLNLIYFVDKRVSFSQGLCHYYNIYV